MATAIVARLLGWTWLNLVAVLLLALTGWSWWLIGRQVRSWGYAERDDDLLLRHGVMWRRLLVVPYGRLQFVDVEAGPLASATGHRPRAAAHRLGPLRRGDPGSAAAEAARLRDRLASRGEAQLAGL